MRSHHKIIFNRRTPRDHLSCHPRRVPELAAFTSRLLAAEQRRRGTPRGSRKLTWSGWGTATTTGTGTLEIDNCTPNCASGTYTGYPATITLSGLRPYGHREAYSEMVVTAPTAPDSDGDLSYHTGLVP